MNAPPCFVCAVFLSLASLSLSLVPARAVEGPLATAERLLETAERGKLTNEEAAQAAVLLEHDAPFVRGLAYWALAEKVARENKAETAAWPRPDAPGWFEAFATIDGKRLIEADYVRQGAAHGVHRRPPLGSLPKIIARAEGVAAELRATAGIDAAAVAEVDRRIVELRRIHDEIAARARKEPKDLVPLRKLWIEARMVARGAALANPAVDFDQLLLVKRHPALFPNITGSQYPWSHKPGGGMYVQTGLTPGGEIRNVLDGGLGPGHVHGIDLWWNADRVVFGYARQPDWPPSWDTLSGDFVFLLRGEQEPTHIFEINLDGTGLRQLTDHRYWSDFEPTYLADGGAAFASDRSGRSSECGKFSADHTVINLYAVSADGKQLRRLSDNKDIDRYPHTLDNGLVAYTRWDYQERHFLETHAIWTVRPDGTMSDAVFNQHLRAPYGLRDSRSIPGSSRLVSIATGHHTLAYGPLVVVDPAVAINDPAAVRIVTPRVAPQEGPMAGVPVDSGGPPDCGGVYQTPWALSERCFLTAYSYDSARNAAGFGIYLVDVHGNKELLARDPMLSCVFPIPVKKRPRPMRMPVMARSAEPQAAEDLQSTAVCYISDIYEGMPGVERGTIKHVRISQRVGWPLDDEIGAMRYLPGNAWERKFGHYSWAPVRVIGTVEVADDGSAHFRVPADTAVYFQALDEDMMEVRRMRSHVTLQAGEVRGCRGCHETQQRTPAADWASLAALRSEPQTPQPPWWGAETLLGYEKLIQPVLDNHCVRCHGPEQPDGGLDFTAAKSDDGFMQSFRTMFGLAPGESPGKAATGSGPVLVSVSNRLSGAAVSRPKQFGSHRSRLVRVLLDDQLHRKECRLDAREWEVLVTWVDANAPYYDKFYNRRPTDGGEPRREVAWGE